MDSPVHLKVELAISGLRLAPELAAEPALFTGLPSPAVSGGDVELLLADDVIACCPVGTASARHSPYELRTENDRFYVAQIDSSGTTTEKVGVDVIAPPAFLRNRTSRGTAMNEIGAVHAGYVSIDLSDGCGFAESDSRCTLCRSRTDPAPDTTRSGPPAVADVLEVIGAAFAEGAAEFVYFDVGFSGTPDREADGSDAHDPEDGGFSLIEPYVSAVKREFDTLVAVQSHPPGDHRWIDRTYAAGVDALSYPICIHDEQRLADVCPGRANRMPRERYYEALAYAARIFPSGTVWSDLLIGMESEPSTRAGIDRLTGMGVLPILSLRPSFDFTRSPDEPGRNGSPLIEPDAVAPLYAHLYQAVRDAKINVQHMRDLGYAITPMEARFFAGENAKLDVAVSSFYRSRLGSRAVRGLSKLRRRLRVRRVSESFDSSQL
jgi:sodium-dependent dicarboxylate transporter 2/3/5